MWDVGSVPEKTTEFDPPSLNVLLEKAINPVIKKVICRSFFLFGDYDIVYLITEEYGNTMIDTYQNYLMFAPNKARLYDSTRQ